MGKKRKKIGIVFGWDESWAGGLYYLLNVIHALNTLPEGEKPELFIYDSNERNLSALSNIHYPYLYYKNSLKNLNLVERIINKLCRKLTGYNVFSMENIGIIDHYFPLYEYRNDLIYDYYKSKRIFWIPDFQHKHLPEYFSSKELELRDRIFGSVANKNVRLVLSSNDAREDFVRFFPKYKCKIFVVPFAVTLPPIDHLTRNEIIKKYGLNEIFFIAPNQFWAHKNHIIILRALKILKQKGVYTQIVFTGKEDDYRNQNHVGNLKQFILENQLNDYIKSLGFIDRADQLKLIQESIAVIQPSLFEGWSTVVEDSKALNKGLILSNLKVHHEQCGQNVLYFDPNNEVELANHIIFVLENIDIKPFYPLDYSSNVIKFGVEINKVFIKQK